MIPCLNLVVDLCCFSVCLKLLLAFSFLLLEVFFVITLVFFWFIPSLELLPNFDFAITSFLRLFLSFLLRL